MSEGEKKSTINDRKRLKSKREENEEMGYK